MISEQDDMRDFLVAVAADPRLEADTRGLAAKTLQSWDVGIIPTPQVLRRLRHKLPRPMVCARLRSDGGCLWLNRHAREVGLLPPGPGEKLVCTRDTHGVETRLFSACPGFMKGDW